MKPSLPHLAAHPAAMTSRGDGATLPKLLYKHATERPHALALREKKLGIWRRISWSCYLDNVLCLAHVLQGLGFQPGDRLAIAGEGTPEWMYADLAAQLLGGMVVGLYPTSPASEIAYVLGHAKVSVVVCQDQEQTDKVLQARAEHGLPALRTIVCVDPKGLRGYRDEGLVSFEVLMDRGRESLAGTPAAREALLARVAGGSPDDVAVVVYTSGTTGKPKGALLTQRNLVAAGSAIVDTFGFHNDNLEVLCYLPLCHVAERSFSTVMHLVCGSIVNYAESVETVAPNLREIAPTMFLGVPRIWEKLQHTVLIKLGETYRLNRWVVETALRQAIALAREELEAGGRHPGVLSRLRLALMRATVFRNIRRFIGLHRAQAAFCGAASVSPEVLLFFRALGLPIFQVYGMTETAAVAFQQRPGHTRPGAVGLPIAGLDYQLAEDGELLMRGPTVFNGYLDDDAATSEILRGGWLHSGDIARQEDDGEISIIDRKKEIIITSGGKNISPSEIENALKQSVYIREAIVIGEGRKFISALLQIDTETVGKWAQQQGLPFTTFRSLTEMKEVDALIDAEVNRVNADLARVAQVRRFVLLAKELDHDDGELTATMKVKRRAVEAKFADLIGSLYGASA